MAETPRPDFNCSCNPLPDSGEETDLCCSSKPDVFTEEELEIFDQLRMLKEEVWELKRRLEEIDADRNGQPLTPQMLDEKQQCSERIDALRREWNRLKKLGDEACTSFASSAKSPIDSEGWHCLQANPIVT